MGSYTQALSGVHTAGTQNPSVCGTSTRPCIEATRTPGRLKAGIGLNVEERIYGPLSASCLRGGWSTGDEESFAYTEAEDTVEVGLHVDGASWRRAFDNVGVAYVTNGLSVPHRQYLAAGGLGFLLGDGFLRYGREHLLEGYYNAAITHGLFAAVDVQYTGIPATIRRAARFSSVRCGFIGSSRQAAFRLTDASGLATLTNPIRRRRHGG